MVSNTYGLKDTKDMNEIINSFLRELLDIR